MLSHSHWCIRCDETWTCPVSSNECMLDRQLKRHGCWQEKVYNRMLRAAMSDETGETNYPPATFLNDKNVSKCKVPEKPIIVDGKHTEECICTRCRREFEKELR